MPARTYADLTAGEEGVLFYTEDVPNQPGLTLHRYKLEDREAKKLPPGRQGFALSADGKKLLWRSAGGNWGIVDAAGEPRARRRRPRPSGMRMKVDPAGRVGADVPRGLALPARLLLRRERARPGPGLGLGDLRALVDHVRHRADLTYLLDILGGETAVGHSFTGGGDNPDIDAVPVGLLGADFAVEDGRYRIARSTAARTGTRSCARP